MRSTLLSETIFLKNEINVLNKGLYSFNQSVQLQFQINHLNRRSGMLLSRNPATYVDVKPLDPNPCILTGACWDDEVYCFFSLASR